MNGLECLKKELIERGFNKAQADSKVVIGVLEIVANSNGKYTDLNRLNAELETMQKAVETKQREYGDYSRKVEAMRKDFEEIMATIETRAYGLYKETKDYIDKYFESLKECETPEKRDAVRVANAFINSVTVKTVYDNTEFIKGLASVLSGVPAPIDELHKINKDIPKVNFHCEPGSVYPEGEYHIGTEEKRVRL